MAPLAVQCDSMAVPPLHAMDQVIESIWSEETKKPQGRSSYRVSFIEFDQIYEVDHIDDMPEQQVSAIYASREELAAIRSRCKLYIEAMNNGVDSNETDSLRGLEGYAPVNTRKRLFLRSQVYDSVDEMQAFQDKTGLDVSDMMSQICEKFSKSSVLAAQEVGISDALAAICD
jgi:hypothetical protein